MKVGKTKKKFLKKQKRHQLLLEVMIAFALIVICVIPLLQPHWFMLRFQQAFIQQVELDHLVNLLYGDIIEQLYTNEIDWKSLENPKEVEIDSSMLRHVEFNKELPFKGSYHFYVIKKKSNKKADLTVYLFGLDFQFSKEGSTDPPQKYHYEFPIIRDLAKGKEEEPGEERTPPPEKPPSPPEEET